MTLKEKHSKSMDLSQKAIVAVAEGDEKGAILLYNEAFFLEKEVVLGFIDSEDNFTKGVLIKSAASLAKKANLIQEAKEMVELGLSMDLPENILNDLRLI